MINNKELINQISKSSSLNFSINLTKIGILIFTFVFCVYKSFLASYKYQLIILLVFSLLLLFFGSLVHNNARVIISRVDIMWMLFLILFVTNITLNNLISNNTVIDILVYTSCLIFMIFAKVNFNYFERPLALIKIMGIVYASSAIFQYLYTDLYMQFIFPLFSAGYQENIYKLFLGNSYTGLTNQTAHIAGYIVNAIGVIIFSNWKKKTPIKVISMILLAILFIGLLLSAKRAHLLFMIASLLITALISIKNKDFFNKIIKLITAIIAVIFIATIFYKNINFSDDSAIVNFVGDLRHTFSGFIAGEDVSSGRIILYSHSWGLFEKKPIFGIGWKEFMNESIGLLNYDRGSHPHNIYLQLLTELGIFGFLLFVIPVIYVYFKTFRLLRLDIPRRFKLGIQFSFYSQTFFILYGLTGNGLTDYNFLLMYFFACSISISILLKSKIKQMN